MEFAASSRKDPNINRVIIANTVFPLPPLAEQKRIVEKLERLLLLCDGLKLQVMKVGGGVVMSEKKSFVFDTNFIIQVKDLNKVMVALKDSYNVYVPQLSIDERVAQQCRELKQNYEELRKNVPKYLLFAKIEILKDTTALEADIKEKIQQKYEKLFGSNIIPFVKTVEMFDAVINRANSKLAPFSKADNSSDKGFKDALIWISLLEFFKEKGDEEVIFITNDAGFLKNGEELANEFSRVTGKKIEIKDSKFYSELITKERTQPSKVESKEVDICTLRNRIQVCINALCKEEAIDDWGIRYLEHTFKSNQRFDEDYMELIFMNLRENIEKNIFEMFVSPFEVFDFDNRVYEVNSNISISDLENALELYEEIKSKCPSYLKNFYLTCANIFNDNFLVPMIDFEDGIPF